MNSARLKQGIRSFLKEPGMLDTIPISLVPFKEVEVLEPMQARLAVKLVRMFKLDEGFVVRLVNATKKNPSVNQVQLNLYAALEGDRYEMVAAFAAAVSGKKSASLFVLGNGGKPLVAHTAIVLKKALQAIDTFVDMVKRNFKLP